MLIKKLFIGTPTILFVGRATKQPAYDTLPMYMGTSWVLFIFCHQLEISNIQYLLNFHTLLMKTICRPLSTTASTGLKIQSEWPSYREFRPATGNSAFSFSSNSYAHRGCDWLVHGSLLLAYINADRLVFREKSLSVKRTVIKRTLN